MRLRSATVSGQAVVQFVYTMARRDGLPSQRPELHGLPVHVRPRGADLIDRLAREGRRPLAIRRFGGAVSVRRRVLRLCRTREGRPEPMRERSVSRSWLLHLLRAAEAQGAGGVAGLQAVAQGIAHEGGVVARIGGSLAAGAAEQRIVLRSGVAILRADQGAVEVERPLPDQPVQVVQAVGVRGVPADRREAARCRAGCTSSGSSPGWRPRPSHRRQRRAPTDPPWAAPCPSTGSRHWPRTRTHGSRGIGGHARSRRPDPSPSPRDSGSRSARGSPAIAATRAVHGRTRQTGGESRAFYP